MSARGEVLVLGATGHVGSAVVRELTSRGVSVRAATRDPAEYDGPDGARAVRFDLDNASTWDAALNGVAALHIIPKPADAAPDTTLIPLLDRAHAVGVRRVVLMTADGVQHAPAEAGILKTERHASAVGMGCTIVRPTWFMQNFTTGFLNPMVRGGTVYLPAGDGGSPFIDTDDVGAVIAEVLTGEGYVGRTCTLTGPEVLTYAQAAAVLSEVAGRDIRYQQIPEERMRVSLEQAGWGDAQIEVMLGLFRGVSAGAHAHTTGDVRRILGRAPRAFADFARANAQRLQAA